MNNKITFIAEAGINHDGDIEKAKRLIDAAKDAGADYVKFQSFRADDLALVNARTSSYIDSGSYEGEDFRALLRRLELSTDDQIELRNYAALKSIKFLSTPFHEEMVDFLIGLGVDRIKVASGDLTNTPLLRAIGGTHLPVILSTGMGTLGEIERALDDLVVAGAKDITLLHCVSWYPARIDSINLYNIQTLQHAFGLPVGFSDHTLGISIALAACGMGATVIEKHFTLNRLDFGPDHKASLEPGEMKSLVQGVREIEIGLGRRQRKAQFEEIGQQLVHRRSICIRQSIPEGTMLRLEHLVMKRPGDGISPTNVDRIIGRVTRRELLSDHKLTWEDLQ
jgi:N,N'-diacetyllegionaminate synthase